jgi:biotin-(acetyl-CoA carboxylase) ligase
MLHLQSLQNEYELKLQRKFDEQMLINKINTHHELVSTNNVIHEYESEIAYLNKYIKYARKMQNSNKDDLLRDYEEKCMNLEKVLKMEQGKYANLKKTVTDQEFTLSANNTLSLTITTLLHGKLKVD